MSSIEYSEVYEDNNYFYRHVILPKYIASKLPTPLRLLSKEEWIKLGIQQRKEWIHYEIYEPEPHVLLFRRSKIENKHSESK